ncbi:Agamous-like mads-box protein agl61 [Thalictrum thalictroides]|uniref:Agamous-like mads-box protein agl61 n=1 Tax=Thalictrum thalictroides TaxID=46969 RepID=A0A7J6VC74_THATH|nr:Agamous-like mads-box protein agl61 [Thalictrum thalictroides]
MDTTEKKRGTGRKKVPIEKIESSSQRYVTFSKRRTGLFKKASELCILCGAEIAIVVFSPREKVYTFGNPSVDSVVDRFLNQHNHMNALEHDHLQQQKQFIEVSKQLEAEKKKEVIIENLKLSGWDAPIDSLQLYELQQMKQALVQVKKKVVEEFL